MPVTAQAAKKLRHDRKRSLQNTKQRKDLREAVKSARKSPGKKTLSAAFASLDKAAKTGIVHRNKAARLKSRLSKLTGKK